MKEEWRPHTVQFTHELWRRISNQIAKNPEVSFNGMVRTLCKEALDAREKVKR